MPRYLVVRTFEVNEDAMPDVGRRSREIAEEEFPGTKVLRWENDLGVPRDVTRFSHVSVAVTGTHDTESLWTWWESLADWEREHQLKQPQLAILRGPDQKRYTPQTRDALLELAYSASSDALLTRRLVDNAKRVLVTRLGISDAEAFQRILERKLSMGRSLRDTAWTIIEAEGVVTRHDFALCLKLIFQMVRQDWRSESTRQTR